MSEHLRMAPVDRHSLSTNPEDVPGIVRPYNGGLIKYCQAAAVCEDDTISYGEWGLYNYAADIFNAYTSPYIVTNDVGDAGGLATLNGTAGICLAADHCPEGYWAYFMLRGWYANAISASAAYAKGTKLMIVDVTGHGNQVSALAVSTPPVIAELDRWVATAMKAGTVTALDIYVHVPTIL